MGKVIDLRANGKLLLTGEYLVLAGAKALALPLKFGQHLRAVSTPGKVLHWSSLQPAGVWFECQIDLLTLESIQASDNVVAAKLSELLQAARRLNRLFLMEPHGYRVTTAANYPVMWGLGSSSTLLSMVAEWAAVPAFDLLRLVSRGSGYDIACAGRDGLLFYQLKDAKPEVTDVVPGMAIRRHALFAWLGNKQESSSEVNNFLAGNNYTHEDVLRVSELSSLIAAAETAAELCSLVTRHEQIIGRILSRDPLSKRFPEFPGAVKSLGAWGGDFGMFVSALDFREVKILLAQTGITDVFTFDEIKATN